MKVYDAFLFFNELDMLEIRLNELSPVVDRFVLLEATVTHQYEPKPLFFEENKERFKEFLPKITHLIERDTPKDSAGTTHALRGTRFDPSFKMERYSLGQVARGLQDVADDDIVIVSDLDEIPEHTVVEQFKNQIKSGVKRCRVRQKLYFFYLNWIWPHSWIGPVISVGSYFKNGFEGSPQKARDFQKKMRDELVSGWHFSYMGGWDSVKYKVRSISSAGLFKDYGGLEQLEKNFKNGDAPISKDGANSLRSVPIDKTYPKYVRENLEKFGHLIRT